MWLGAGLCVSAFPRKWSQLVYAILLSTVRQGQALLALGMPRYLPLTVFRAPASSVTSRHRFTM